MIPHRFLLMLLLAAGLTTPAMAQINPYRGSKASPLNADDLAALTAASERLLDRPQLVAGGTEPWTNPKSGASGTVTAGAPVSRNGLTCRVVNYTTFLPGPGPERRTTLTLCKTKDGWKIG